MATILSIAVLGKQGQPLWLEPLSASGRGQGQAQLKWDYAAHTSLDFFDEREMGAGRSSDAYLGLLYAMEDYAVYGYQTNTRVKFVLILALADAVIRDIDVKTIFRAIHNAYIGYLSNPFTSPTSQEAGAMAPPIRSKRFTGAMRTIAGVQETNQPPSPAP